MAARRSAPWGLLLAAFLVLPLVEIYLLVQVGQVIGAGWTILLLVLDSVVGIALVRREGTRAWRELQRSLAQGRPPTRELADGALLLVGATLMVTPGFLTDAMGLLLVLPVTRPLLRGVVARWIAARVVVAPGGPARAYGGGFGPGSGPGARHRPTQGSEDVVPGVVVESHDEQGGTDDEPPRR